MDQRDVNEGRLEREERRLTELRATLEDQRMRTQRFLELNNNAEAVIIKVLKGIDDLVRSVCVIIGNYQFTFLRDLMFFIFISSRLARCDCTPLLSLLGNHKEVTKWNVSKFLKILEAEVKSLIEVAYGAVKVLYQNCKRISKYNGNLTICIISASSTHSEGAEGAASSCQACG